MSANGDRRTFSWTFSFGPKPDELKDAIEAARREGIEPESKSFNWEWNGSPAEEPFTDRRDPLQSIRTVLSWLPLLAFLGLFLGGIIVGFLDPTVGPYWGGIMGGVLGAFFYKMMEPFGRKRW